MRQADWASGVPDTERIVTEGFRRPVTGWAADPASSDPASTDSASSDPVSSDPAFPDTFLSAPLAADYLAAPAGAEHSRLTLHPSVAPESPDGSPASGPALRVPPFAADWHGDTPPQWPLHTFLELGALDGAVPSARLHARHVLREWGQDRYGDSAELVVSELVTNGVKATRALAQAAIRLWLFSDRQRIAVMVWDASSQPPVRMEVNDDAENGRGLLLVEAVSDQWGWCFPGDTPAGNHHGKFVWAIIG
jgi:anti-sigma regulatory factor (Ser/Thr protein kinase)